MPWSGESVIPFGPAMPVSTGRDRLRFGIDQDDLVLAGFREIDVSLARDDEIVRLRVGREHVDGAGLEVERDEPLLRALAGVEPSIRPELQPARRLVGNLRLHAIDADAEDGRRFQVREVEVPRFIAARPIGKAEAVRDELPFFAGNEEAVQSHVAGEVLRARREGERRSRMASQRYIGFNRGFR